MANSDVIKKFLPESLWDEAATFDIQDSFIESETELVVMILESKSIDTKEEKQNWFNLLPLMNDDQVEKLRWILLKEKRKLKEIEEKYEKKKEEIKKKYKDKRDAKWQSDNMQKIKSEEKEIAKKDSEQADDLLELI